MSKEIVAILALSTLLVVVWLSWPESPPACADAEWQTLLRWRTLHKNNSLLLGRCHVDTYEHAMAIALKVGDQETFFLPSPLAAGVARCRRSQTKSLGLFPHCQPVALPHRRVRVGRTPTPRRRQLPTPARFLYLATRPPQATF
jgi:hypothetical protein